MLIQELTTDPLYYVMVIVAVMVSIVLHELAHGFAAMWQGDDTPLRTGHITLNPLVHMGGFSIVALCVCGIAWGQMPVNPVSFRSRYGDALVSVAGPLSNLLIAVIALTLGGLWEVHSPVPESALAANTQSLLWILGVYNIMLCLFNLFPIPPLDGSHILASFNEPYARFIDDPENQQVLMFGFIVAFVGITFIFTLAVKAANHYYLWLASLAM
jgi:Zn-dependent protease